MGEVAWNNFICFSGKQLCPVLKYLGTSKFLGKAGVRLISPYTQLHREVDRKYLRQEIIPGMITCVEQKH